MAALISASLFSLLINTNWVNAKVLCVDKYNFTSFVPCSDQNAIDKDSVKTNQMSSGNMTAAGSMSNSSGPNAAVVSAPPSPNTTTTSETATYHGVTLPYTGFCPNNNWTAKVLDVKNGEFVEDAQYDFYYTHYHYVYCYVPGAHGDRGPFFNPRTGLYESAGSTSSSVPTGNATSPGGNSNNVTSTPLTNATQFTNATTQTAANNAISSYLPPGLTKSIIDQARNTNATKYALQHAIGATTAAMNKTAGLNASAAATSALNILRNTNATSFAAHNIINATKNTTALSATTRTQPNPAGTNQSVINNPVVKQNDRYYEGLNWWAVCNNPLLHSNISLSCDVLVTQDKNALTSKGKVALEGILCPRVHPLLRR